MDDRPCGVFDSGVGGLSVLREMWLQLPGEDLLYFADQAHVPYGNRRAEEIRAFSEGITRFLLEQGAKLIVVACNTASAAALQHLRAVFPEIPFVGMEPAVKPAAKETESGIVGVLATPGTLRGELHASVVERFADGVRILEHPLPGMVEMVEQGQHETPEANMALEQAVRPLLQQGADTLVLACTHYPFLIPSLRRIAGPAVRIIDPSPAVARQAARLLEQGELRSSRGQAGQLTLFSSKDARTLLSMTERLIKLHGAAKDVRWVGSELILS
jgi:glutamate racemase